MEAVVFIGLQGAGKSSFYKEQFFSTHVRISLDLVKTRYRELKFLEVCLLSDQRFVIDNTNLTRVERSKYIEAAKASRYRISGYYFQSEIENCLLRNTKRPESDRVPDVAIFSSAKKLELPSFGEGFDQLFYVRIQNGKFVIEDWKSEV